MSQRILLVFLFLLITVSTFYSQDSKNQLIVGTKVAEPFVVKSEGGEWSGVAISLWENIAREMNVEYKIQEYDLEGLIKAVSEGEVDIGVSPMTITAEREKLLDFSHPYFITGLFLYLYLANYCFNR